MENEFGTQILDVVIQDAVGEQRTISSIESYSTFIKDEQRFWSEAISGLPGIQALNRIIGPLNEAQQDLNNFANQFPNLDENGRQQQLNHIKGRAPQIFPRTIFSDTPAALAFLEACQRSQQHAQSFLNYLTNFPGGWLENNQFPSLEGAILAYEFKNQDESGITKRRKSEERANSALRKKLSDKTDELITQVATFQKNTTEEMAAFRNDVEEWRNTLQNELHERAEFDKTQREQFFADADTRLKELEALYKEKLKLEGPADYWQKRASAFKISGRWWGAALVVTTISVGGVFAWLFYEWLSSGKVIEKFSAQHWQGVILLGAVLSMFIFLIRTFGKMTFSSFHLQRDAEEREQLAYLYLALSKETEFGEESRKIVLQSLFSRSETGLLSGEHGPTMPVSDVAKQISQAGGR